jgi:hypothetical protein
MIATHDTGADDTDAKIALDCAAFAAFSHHYPSKAPDRVAAGIRPSAGGGNP